MARKTVKQQLKEAMEETPPNVIVQNCEFTNDTETLAELAKAVKANAEAIQSIANKVNGGPMLTITGKVPTYD